jgi:hypothetical protein
VATQTSVAAGTDLTSWVTGLTIPEHEGYEFDEYVTYPDEFDYADVQMSGTITIKYKAIPVSEDHAYYFVNPDGDFGFTLQPAETLTGTGTVAIQFSDDITGYDSYAVMEFPDGGSGETKTSTSITGGTVTFEDIDISTTGPYIVMFYDSNNNKIPASTFVTNNVIPSHATITQSSETKFSADIAQAGN